MPLSEAQRRFLEERHFAVLGTTNPSGSPNLTVMWYLLDGEDILFNTRAGRQKERNLTHDPRASLVVYDHANPYRYLRIDGRVREDRDPARTQADIRRIALRYYADEARVERSMRDSFGRQQRVSYRLPTTRVSDLD